MTLLCSPVLHCWADYVLLQVVLYAKCSLFFLLSARSKTSSYWNRHLKLLFSTLLLTVCVLTSQKLEVHLQYMKSWFLYLEVASVIADKVAAVLAIAQDLFNHHNVKRKVVELVWQQLNFLKMC